MVYTDELGEIKVDDHGHTSLRGIVAAGYATESYNEQIIMAAGQGARAALGAFEYLQRI